MLYQALALTMEALQPLHQTAKTARYFYSHPLNPFRQNYFVRHMNAGLELFERLSAYYAKPEFGIQQTTIDGNPVAVREECVLNLPYMRLLHFRKEREIRQPTMLIVAPLSGHFATLLRNTVTHLLPMNDIYITDWTNARDVPLYDGEFHLDDYTDYVIESLRLLGENTHLLAICQSTVPSLMAVAMMSEDGDSAVPPSMTMIAGPVDTRVNPTAVNDYAGNHDFDWFENNVIFTVPPGYPGAGQKVYPGFMQLAGFLSLSWNDHLRRHQRFYSDLIKNDGDSAEAHRVFYNEYLAVLDMSAPFYLETIKRVFIDIELPQGKATHRGRPIHLDAISETALMTIEGGADNICGPGQTEAAHSICKNIPAKKRARHVEPLVGHYGAWNGSKFRNNVSPRLMKFISEHDRQNRIKSIFTDRSMKQA